MAVPQLLVEANSKAMLAMDVFFVDRTAFLLMVSRRIKFVTAEHVPIQMAKCLGKHLKRVLEMYRRAGFRARTVLMDEEFEKLKPIMPTIECNTTAAKEHVSKVDHTRRMLKKQVHGLLSVQPFEHIPKRVKIEFVHLIVLWLNAFSVRMGILSKYLPQELLVRWRLDYKKHCRVLTGTYCEAHDEPVPSNSMKPWIHEMIALELTRNLQGRVKFTA